MAGANRGHGFTHGSAGGDDIVHDRDVAGERGPDNCPALAVILDLLAIEAEGHVSLVQCREGNGRCTDEGNAFVGGSVEYIEVQVPIGNSDGVKLAEATQAFSAVE